MKRSLHLASLLVPSLVLAAAGAQQQPDPGLRAEIGRIRAIDNHSHAAAAADPGDEPRDPVGKSPFEYPLRLRVDNPEYADAWAALWGRPPAAAERPRSALRAKWSARRTRADAYPAWVLDQAGIDVALINTDRLGPGQTPPRFRWVPMADELLFPMQNGGPRFRQILTESGLSMPPATLDQYLSRIVAPTLERWKTGGAVAIKLAVAYRRPLDFAETSEADAARVYASVMAGAAAAPAEHKMLQDYLFRRLCAEAGRAGLLVHIHTGVGADPYFNISGSRPSLLEPALNDPALRGTRFVLVHGGWPFDRETGVLLMKPNVYADFSAQTFLRSTHALAETLRAWLEWYPEKVLFGTDAYPEDLMGVAAPLAGWEEKTWLAARSSRDALALALTQMVSEGLMTRARALDVARLVLRGNAERLYEFNRKGG